MSITNLFKNTIIIFVILIFLPSVLKADAVTKSLKLIRAGDYEEAQVMLEDAYNESENNFGLNYSLALYFFMQDHKGFDVFKANKYMLKCLDTYSNSSESDKNRYQKHGIRPYTINKLKSEINMYAYDLADSINTLEIWEQFAAEFTSSPKLKEAKEKRNELAFNAAQNEDSYESFQDFMKKYPNASQIGYAKELYEKQFYKQNTAGGSYRDFKKFAEEHPESPYAEEAMEQYEYQLYKTVTATGTLEAYVDFINNYSNSPYAEEAQDSVYILSITEGSIEKYTDFVHNFLNNKNVNMVWQLLYEEYNFNKDTKTYLEFQRSFPKFPFKEQLEKDIRISKRQLELYEDDEGLFGYKNTVTGVVDINSQFEDAYEFSEGMAAVSSSCGDICNYGYIDKEGKLVIDEIYYEAWSFKNGLALVSKGNCDDIPCKWGYIDRNGVSIVPIIYDDVYPFSEEMALVGKDDKGYGFVNIGGREIIPLQYEDAEPFSEGLAAVSSNEKWGFIDNTGEFKIPASFSKAGSFSNELAPVQDPGSGLWGYIDHSGNYKIKPQFKFAKSFENNRAGVMVEIESNGMQLMTEKQIDKNGAFVN